MKKLFLLLIAAALALAAIGALSEPDTAEASAHIGDVAFSLSNEQSYYDVSYRYPDEFELEIREDDDPVRHILRYRVDGYDPTAVGIVVSRASGYTPEERLAEMAFIGDVTTEEINGATWAIGTAADASKRNVIVYACAAAEYTYTFSFSTDYPADFDFADFAAAFAREVIIGNQ